MYQIRFFVMIDKFVYWICESEADCRELIKDIPYISDRFFRLEKDKNNEADLFLNLENVLLITYVKTPENIPQVDVEGIKAF